MVGLDLDWSHLCRLVPDSSQRTEYLETEATERLHGRGVPESTNLEEQEALCRVDRDGNLDRV